MSVPRLVVSGLATGPALALAAGSLVACGAQENAVRSVTLGIDVPLYRLLSRVSERAPRMLDPVLLDDGVSAELIDVWSDSCELLVVVAVEPALDRWRETAGSRAVDVCLRLDAPLVLVVDARDNSPTAAAAACGLRALAPEVELAGVIIVGGDEHGAGAELGAMISERAELDVLGWIPAHLSEPFAAALGAGGAATAGSEPTGLPDPAALCQEAARHLRRDALVAAASRRGFVPRAPRRLLAPSPDASGLSLAVAWGPPLEPFAVEGLDLLRAMGVTLAPVHIGRDRALPPRVDGLLLAGLLREDDLPVFAANTDLKSALCAAIEGGLPTLAFAGGALLLLRRLVDSRGRCHDLAGVWSAEAEVLDWYQRPRYVRAAAARANPYDEGDGELYELFDLEFLTLQQEAFAYRLGDDGVQAEGFVRGRLLATTLIPSLPARRRLAASFVSAMGGARATR